MAVDDLLKLIFNWQGCLSARGRCVNHCLIENATGLRCMSL